ncbi:unnamed protein product [Sphenostylis stenocarpa]|uniref:Uncharacterized protein n=1 Tax=Sphenostylis stenocarpa TaxID=92480 RepID=A0AA86SCL4_9FABA|nr:unnamed protein product [Sphenostylis stenocarpa]
MAAGADAYAMVDSFKIHERVNSQILTGVMAFVMGILTMVKMTRNMPKKLTDANFYSNLGGEYKGQANNSDQMTIPAVSAQEFMTVMKRMAELEEKMTNMNNLTICMPPEKEEMLNAAITRADTLEQELMATKKALEESLAKQQELSAYVEKKKKKKKMMFIW